MCAAGSCGLRLYHATSTIDNHSSLTGVRVVNGLILGLPLYDPLRIGGGWVRLPHPLFLPRTKKESRGMALLSLLIFNASASLVFVLTRSRAFVA